MQSSGGVKLYGQTQVREELFGADESPGDVQNRACAPPDEEDDGFDGFSL